MQAEELTAEFGIAGIGQHTIESRGGHSTIGGANARLTGDGLVARSKRSA